MPFPVLQNLVLADHVYRDGETNKYIICGIFSKIFFNPPIIQLPSGAAENRAEPAETADDEVAADESQNVGIAPPQDNLVRMPIQSVLRTGSVYIYFALTELQGRKEFEFRYVSLKDNSVLFSLGLGIECHDPLETVEGALVLPPLPVPNCEEGVFALELLCENTLLGWHRVQARRMEDRSST